MTDQHRNEKTTKNRRNQQSAATAPTQMPPIAALWSL